MTFIIAEAGTCHYAEEPDDRLKNAIQCVFDAQMTGADAVKFQMFVPDEELFCPLEGDEKRWKRWEKTFLTKDQWAFVQSKCWQYNIDFLASVFQHRAIEWMKGFKPKYWKVASRAAKNFPYDSVDGTFLISMGLADKAIYPEPPSYRQLQCDTRYPSPVAKWEKYNGLSDHSGTVWPGLDAIFKGAAFLEVHFKPEGLDAGNDEPVCLTTQQLKLLCDARDAVKAWH